MGIRAILEQAAGVPVCRPDYRGDADQYITFHLLGDTGTVYAEGTAAETGTRFSVDLWSKTDYTSLLATVKSALQSSDYYVSVLTEYFEDESGYYHVVLEASCIGTCYGGGR